MRQRWVAGRVPARRMYVWERLWCAVSRSAATFWTTMRHPPLVVDEDAWRTLQAEVQGGETRAAQLAEEVLALEQATSARLIIEDRCGTSADSCRLVAEVTENLPLTASGEVHTAAVSALAEVGLWASRLNDLETRRG